MSGRSGPVGCRPANLSHLRTSDWSCRSSLARADRILKVKCLSRPRIDEGAVNRAPSRLARPRGSWWLRGPVPSGGRAPQHSSLALRSGERSRTARRRTVVAVSLTVQPLGARRQGAAALGLCQDGAWSLLTSPASPLRISGGRSGGTVQLFARERSASAIQPMIALRGIGGSPSPRVSGRAVATVSSPCWAHFWVGRPV